MGDLSDAEIRLRLLEAFLRLPVEATLGDAMTAADVVVPWVKGEATRAECEAAQKEAIGEVRDQDDIAAGIEALKEPEVEDWESIKDRLGLKDHPEA